jgi:hypothetical protein
MRVRFGGFGLDGLTAAVGVVDEIGHEGQVLLSVGKGKMGCGGGIARKKRENLVDS